MKDSVPKQPGESGRHSQYMGNINSDKKRGSKKKHITGLYGTTQRI